jgi:hypothetical protein
MQHLLKKQQKTFTNEDNYLILERITRGRNVKAFKKHLKDIDNKNAVAEKLEKVSELIKKVLRDDSFDGISLMVELDLDGWKEFGDQRDRNKRMFMSERDGETMLRILL